MPQLPYEIWQLISSHLPIEIKRELYSVNSVFFDNAMNLRYQEAWIRAQPKNLLHKDMRIFQYKRLSSCPKTLRIDLGSIGDSIQVALARKTSVLGRMQQFVNSAVTYTPEEIVFTALAALPRLTGVTKIHITYGNDCTSCYDRMVLQLISEIWRVFRGRLKCLCINTCTDMVDAILSPSLHMPCLETFCIDVRPRHRFVGCQVAEPTVIPAVVQFISTHECTLRNVDFNTLHWFPNTLSLLQCLQHTHRLHSISLGLPFAHYFPTPFPVHDLLYRHRRHLEFLSLSFFIVHLNDYCDTALFRQDWSFVDLPNLKELIVNVSRGPAAFWEGVLGYVRRFARSLTTLTIQCQLTYRGVKELSRIFSDFLALQDLSLSVRTLSPDVLAVLAGTLPNLRTLRVFCTSISHNQDEILTNAFLLGQAMQQHAQLFSDWKLESLLCYLESRRSYVNDITTTIADYLPNLKWLNPPEKSDWRRQRFMEFYLTSEAIS